MIMKKPVLKFQQTKKRLCEKCENMDCDKCTVHKSVNQYRKELNDFYNKNNNPNETIQRT